MRGYLVILLFFISFYEINSQVEGLYCGKENCYEILGVTREDDKSTIMRAYRKLARVMHPDRQRTTEKKAEAELSFRKIATAYEILRDDEQRKEYDYMLDNPDEMYYHYYQYFRRRYGPKVDVRIVIVIIISLISIAQYYGQCTNYNDAIRYLTRDHKYRLKAKEIAKKEGLLSDSAKKRESGRKKTKEEVKNQEEELIRKIITEKMDIKGGYAKPSVVRTLWLQLLLLPYWIGCLVWDWIRWACRYWLLKKPYSRDDQLRIICRLLQLSQIQWDAVTDEEKEYYIELELWKKENFEEYRKEKEVERKEKLASDPNYKRYRRFMKKGGANQITFGQEDVEMEY